MSRNSWVCLAIWFAACTPAGVKLPSDDHDASMHTDAGIDAGGKQPVDAGDEDAGDGGADGSIASLCYLDADRDGFGTGDGRPCSEVTDAGASHCLASDGGASGTDSGAVDGGAGDGAVADAGADAGACQPGPGWALVGGDCDDANQRRAPGVSETCDGVDNDCDTEIDENIKNACGGVCVRPLDHEPGDACTNNLLGACLREGKYACTTDSATACDAPQVVASSEVCGDDADNDCDGAVDEPDAIDAPTWYLDCDGDGYAAATDGAVKACVQPTPAVDCKAWTSLVPSKGSTWDCNDTLKEYSPKADYGYPPVGSASFDLNCDGLTQKAPTFDVLVNGGPTTFTYPLCSATVTCNCAKWLNASGDETSSPPACSPTTHDTRPINLSALQFDNTCKKITGGVIEASLKCR